MADNELMKPELTASMVQQDAGKGNEHIAASDVMVARLSISQKTSPQLERKRDEYIEGLQVFQLFNNITGQNYGEKVKGVVLAFMGLRAMEFQPFDQGGGVLDYNVPLDDPRCQWDEENRKPPIATIFDDFVVLLPETFEVVAISMKTFSRKTARKLRTLQKTPLKYKGTLLPDPPAFLRVFEFGVATKEVNKNTVGYFSVKPAGIVDDDLYLSARDLHAFYSKAKVDFEREAPTPEEHEAQVVDAETGETVPF